MPRPATTFYWKGRGYATDAGGQRTLLVKGPRSKANRELAQHRLALLLGTAPGNRARSASLSLADVINRFLDHCAARVAAGDIKESTLKSYYHPYCQVLKASCGYWTPGDIDHAKILTYRAQLVGRNLAHNTIKNYLAVLRTILRWARRTHLITSDVSSSVPCLPRRRRENIPTPDELERLLTASRPDVRDVLQTLLLTPVRPGDCYAPRPAQQSRG